MPTFIATHDRPTVGVENVRPHVRRDVDPTELHHDPAVQVMVAQWIAEGPDEMGRRTMARVVQRFGLRDVNAAKSAAFYGRRALGIAQPTRRRNGRTETLVAPGQWMVVAARRWGVEVEVNGISISRATEAIAAAGIAVESRNHYVPHGPARGHDRPTVKVEPDGSPGVSAEAVLPPVRGDEGVEMLRGVMTALKGAGARVSSGCGMHVHVDANDLTPNQMVDLFDMWMRVQTAVYSFVPAGRRRSQWASALTTYDHTAVTRAITSGQLTAGDRGRELISRYRGLNVDAYRKYGTVEFRIHGGSLNPAKAKQWVALVVALVEAAKLGLTNSIDGTSAETLVSSLDTAGLLPAGTAEKLIARAQSLR